MPKLSAYVAQKPDQSAADSAGQAASGASGQAALAAAAAGASPPAPEGQQAQQAPQPLLPSQQPAAGTTTSQKHDAASGKLRADYGKRQREHGPRTFRWPDGSLRPERPPPNPHAVANRRLWADLVQHCRTHGGDRTFERQGQSLRYGINVPHAEHAAYLGQIGLEPEIGASGEYVGDVPSLAPPLDDPEHCFNSYYKAEAEAVFKDRRGRLL